MKPRPLIKWKSFWLGILVLGFLGWAWARSMQWQTYAERSRNARWVTIGQGGGLVWFVSDYTEDSLPVGTWSFTDTKRKAKSPLLQTSLRVESEVDYAGVHVAHWFLMLLFLVPWCAWLFFHWKREQKKLTA